MCAASLSLRERIINELKYLYIKSDLEENVLVSSGCCVNDIRTLERVSTASGNFSHKQGSKAYACVVKANNRE